MNLKVLALCSVMALSGIVTFAGAALSDSVPSAKADPPKCVIPDTISISSDTIMAAIGILNEPTVAMWARRGLAEELRQQALKQCVAVPQEKVKKP